MALYVIVGTLAAFGLLSIGWTVLGWLLPGGRGACLVYFGMADEGILTRYHWLRGLGLLCCPLLVVTEEAPERFPGDNMEICSPANLLPRLEMERNRFDGTGNGNPSGRSQRRGISEL